MNALAEARYLVALQRLDDTIELLDGSMETLARAALQKTRGDLLAMKQLLDLEETVRELAEAKTQPALRVVR